MLFCLAARGTSADEAMFPFVVSYDAPANLTNVSAWLTPPAGGQGFIRAENGHLATDAGPIRFWATNSCFEASFPSHEQAQQVAARLARLGINCVRLHHMDARSIWGRSPNHLIIDPEKLERLDYLIAQFKQHGIYVNINLHVSRRLGPAEGFPLTEGRPEMDKGLDNLEPRMIDLQQKYARDLLTHVNPYTGHAYVDEPAVAFIEINNENALFHIWHSGGMDDLPEPFATTYRKVWNAWLRKKYGATPKLRQAWNAQRQPLGKELLIDPALDKPLEKSWTLERDGHTKAQCSLGKDGPQGQRSVRLEVTQQGQVSWHPQLIQSGFALAKDAPYTLTCWLRSDQPRQIHANCGMTHAPWHLLGFSESIKVGPQWTRHQILFAPLAADPKARISFSGFEPGVYELAGVSLRHGGLLGLEADQGIEDDSVPVMSHNASLTAAARRDFLDFLWETEHTYWSRMRHFVKDELHAHSLVTGTQLGYSPMQIQAEMDFIDAHAYWEHPHFPHRPWDRKDWTVHNVALVNRPGGTLSGLAVRRVAGMPFTVSEYNHPQPLEFCGEGFPMIAAFGAFQGWDAIYSFAYSHNDHFEPRQVESFFDIKSDTAKMAHMPACAAMFLRGDVAPARRLIAVPVTKQAERDKIYETRDAWKITADNFGVDPRLSLLHAVAMSPLSQLASGAGGEGTRSLSPLSQLASGAGGEGTRSSEPPLPTDAKVFVSDTGQLRWDLSRKGEGCFTVDTPRSKLFTGFVAGRTFPLGDVELAIGPTQRDWATVSLACMDGEGFHRPGHILVTATGMVRNQGAHLEHLSGDLVTLRDKWGTEPELCEGVAARIVLPVAAARVRVYPLDESGQRRQAIPVADRDGKALVQLDGKYRTVWYEVEIR
jgi:hypothetical protein